MSLVALGQIFIFFGQQALEISDLKVKLCDGYRLLLGSMFQIVYFVNMLEGGRNFESTVFLGPIVHFQKFNLLFVLFFLLIEN